MNLNFFVFVIVYLKLFIISEIFAITSNLLRVTLPNKSKLIGSYLTSNNGNGIRGFLGIPYAEPPIGDLRFRVSICVRPCGIIYVNYCVLKTLFTGNFCLNFYILHIT